MTVIPKHPLPINASNKCSSRSAAYRKHKNIKSRAYGQRIREVVHASFTPLVLSATQWGLAHEATIFYKRLASLSGGIVMPSLWAGFAVACPFPC